MVDRQMINDLFARYTTALDAGEVALSWGASPRMARWKAPLLACRRGQAAIRAFAERFARFRERGSQLRHFISNPAVQVDGNTARATCYLLNVITRDGKTEVMVPAATTANW